MRLPIQSGTEVHTINLKMHFSHLSGSLGSSFEDGLKLQKNKVYAK